MAPRDEEDGDTGGARGRWYRLMNRTPGGVRAVFFVVLSLVLWAGIAWAANVALSLIPTSFGGGGGHAPATRLPWLWNLVFLAIGLWIGSITIWPAPPDPEIKPPYNPSEESRLRTLFAEEDEKLKAAQRGAQSQVTELTKLLDSVKTAAATLNTNQVRALEDRLAKLESSGFGARGNGGAST